MNLKITFSINMTNKLLQRYGNGEMEFYFYYKNIRFSTMYQAGSPQVLICGLPVASCQLVAREVEAHQLSMRKDFKCLNVSLGFSIIKVCPALLMITSWAASPKCLQASTNLKIPRNNRGLH